MSPVEVITSAGSDGSTGKMDSDIRRNDGEGHAELLESE